MLNVENADTQALSEKIEALEVRCTTLEQHVASNTAASQAVQASTAELVEFLTAMKGAFRVLNWIGKLAKPIGAIVACVGACIGAYAAWRAKL